MTSKRLGFISIGVVVVGVLIWVVRSPNGEIAPAADEQAIVDPRPEVGRPPANEEEQATTEVTAALTEAKAEIERLRAELAAAKALADERDNAEITDAPKKPPEAYLAGQARAVSKEARPVFEAEPVDASWAPVAQSELYEKINKRIIDDALAMSLVDVQCRTEACRIELSFSQQPTNPSEMRATAKAAFRLSHQIAKEADSVSFSGLFTMRQDFPGEPTSGELYLFRSGNDGVFLGLERPQGTVLLCSQPNCFPGVEDESSGQRADTILSGLFR